MSTRTTAISTTRAAPAITGPAAPTPLAAHTSFTSSRLTSTRPSAAAVTTAAPCVAWLAGSSAGCRLPCFPKNANEVFDLNAPYYLLRGGDLSSSSLVSAGSLGYYWSSTPNGSSLAYSLYFLSGNVYASYSNFRYYGFSVRCVAAG